MSKQKDPTNNDVGPADDELFDRNLQDESDIDFLAELDQVLAPENSDLDTSADSDQARSPLEEAQVPTEAVKDLEPDLKTDSFESDSGTDDGSPKPVSLFEAQPGKEDAQRFVQATKDLEPDQEPDPLDLDLGIDGESPEPKSPLENLPQAGIDERSLDEWPQAQPGAAGESSEFEPPQPDAQGPVRPREPSGLVQGKPIPRPGLSPVSGLEEPETETESAEETEAETEKETGPGSLREDALASLAGDRAAGVADTIDGGGEAPAKESSSAIWSGLVASLALLGLAVGGAALWQANGMQELLAGIQAQPGVSPVESGRPDPVYIELQGRLDALSSENERLRVDLARLESTLEERIAGQEQELAGTLEGLQSGLEGLEEQLQEQRLDNTAVPSPGAAAKPVVAADREAQVEKPARTEPTARKVAVKPETATAEVPAGRRGWAVNLQSFANRDDAESVLAGLTGMDVPATIVPALIKGKTWYRLQVGGFANQQEAQGYADSVRSKPGLSSAWLSRE